MQDWFRDPYQRVNLVQDWIEMLSKGSMYPCYALARVDV